MTTQYGLTPLGFVIKPQQVIISEIQAAFQAVFGQNINLSPASNFSQIIGIISEREALLWQQQQNTVAAQDPASAEGTAVDNLLALNNLRRDGAQPTKTALASVTEDNGITLYPLVLLGTPGTVIGVDSIVQTNAEPPIQLTLDSAVTIAAASNAVQGLFFSNAPTQGQYVLSIEDAIKNILQTEAIQYNALAQSALLNLSALPASSTSFKLVLTAAGVSLTTATIITNGAYPTAAAIQSAIVALSGYSGVTVSGSAGSYTIAWGAIPNPILTVTANTTTVTITPVDSIQAAINNLLDSESTLYPYTDVTVTVNASNFNINFGLGSPAFGQPVSSAQPQAIMEIVSNTMMSGSSVTNLLVANVVVGAPAQGIGSATCTVDGPNFIGAGSINQIGSPITGWSGVINQLDCVTGTNVEDDTEALVRRENTLNSNANGPLLAVIEKVQAVPNVSQVIGFQNLNEAALQILTFASIPSAGSYVLVINGLPTAPIAYNAIASVIQAAIRLLTPFSNSLVTGNQASGFTVDFNGSLGGQPILPIIITSNSTGVAITQSFGRPGKSIEIVAEGGTDAAIAQEILASKPAGIQTYGNTSVVVFDSLLNAYTIYFSRPTTVLLYQVVSLVTDLYNVPGNPGSGLNPNALFNPSSISTIQSDLVTIGNATKIGGTIIGFGTDGLIGAFNAVPGIISYTLFFGLSPNPSTNTNVALLPEQAVFAEEFNVAVSYT